MPPPILNWCMLCVRCTKFCESGAGPCTGKGGPELDDVQLFGVGVP